MTFEIKTDKNKEQLSVSISKDVKDRLKALAKEREIRVSDLVEQMVIHCLESVKTPGP